MAVRCASRKKIRNVNISSDNLVWLAVFVIALLADLPWSLVTTSLTLLIVCLVTEVFSSIRMANLGARPLTAAQAPALVHLLQLESAALGVKRFSSSGNMTLYCAPRAMEATAFTLGGFRPKLIVTGRLCVAASDSPENVKLILRHELAHIGNHDVLLWQLLITSVVMAVPSLFSGMRYGPDLKLLVANGIGLFANFALLIFLFRRREFLADATALNFSYNRTAYLLLLKSAESRRKSWFHPTVRDRVAALQSDCPVLRVNLIMLFTVGLVAMAGLSFIGSDWKNEASPNASVVLGGLILLAALVVEIAKSPSRKVPLTHADTDFRPLSRAGYLSVLAELFGVGKAQIDWLRASALPISLFAGELVGLLVYGLCMIVLSQGVSSWPAPLTTSLAWAAGWAIVYSCLLLMLLRFSRDLIEVGLGMGFAVALYSFNWDALSNLNDVSLRNDAKVEILAGVLLFWTTLFSIQCLGITVARFRNTFNGLWFGDMYQTVLFSGSTMVINMFLRQSEFGFERQPMWNRGSATRLLLMVSTGAINSAVFAGVFILCVWLLTSMGRPNEAARLPQN
jgi:Zn-dependent protease with chaperone function